MESTKKVQGKRKRRGAARRSSRQHAHCHPFEIRRKAVQLCLEEGFPAQRVARELGVGLSTLSKWIRVYREQGEAGLESHPRRAGSHRPKVAAAVKTKVVDLKRRHPSLGIHKFSHLRRRALFLPVSRETVRRTLHEQQLLKKRKNKPRRNPPRPRFFERTTPNQMWQTDIFTFRLGGKNAHLIGFMDDFSRYLVGADIFRSQTAEHVLEVYRTAVAEYGVPKEVLSDQGRQYASWRGTTRFEAELRKDRVHHIKSRPHHPMTLGKIERFWKTIWEEFLVRAQFDSLESARERIRLWVKHYNHQRPHQSLEGLCPADRFFSIVQELWCKLSLFIWSQNPVTSPDHRGKGLSRRIVSELLLHHNTPLFATTDNEYMRKTLARVGFVRKGKDSLGRRSSLSFWYRGKCLAEPS
jgi:transposase InsO family protein